MTYLTADLVKDRIGDRATDWDDDRITRLVERYEQVAEEYLGCAFWSLDEGEYAPRERTSVEVRARGGDLILDDLFVLEITALSLDGTAWTEDQIGDLDLDGAVGIVRCFNRTGTVVLSYSYGNGEPPQAVLDGCVEYVKARYLGQTTDRNPAIEAYDDNSGYSYTVGRADPANGRPTGLVTVDDALNEVTSHRTPAIG